MANITYEPADIAIYIQDKGRVLKEKSLVAFDAVNSKIIAFGTEAEHIAKGNTENILIISPLQQGMIVDYTVAVSLFTHLLYKALGKKPLRKPAIAICVADNITEVEKKIMSDLFIQIGARELMFIDFPIEQYMSKMPEKFPKEYKRFKVIIEITKDNPEAYIAEELENILKYARKQNISIERVAELFQAEKTKIV